MKLGKIDFIKEFTQMIVDELRLKESTAKKVSKEVVEIMLKEIEDAILSKEGFKIAGFGSMNVKFKEERDIYSALTKKMHNIPEHYIPFFKCSGTFRDILTEGD